MKYISDRAGALALIIASEVIGLIIFYLYGCPREAVLYAAGLSALITLVFCCIDAALLARRRRAVNAMIKTGGADLSVMPAASGNLEKRYQELAETLVFRMTEQGAAAARRDGDTRDYYTMWAHQIKTPIAAMRLLLQSPRVDVRDMEAELFEVERYVDMALNYLRADSDADDLVLRETDVDGVIRACARKYSRLFIMRRVSLDYEPVCFSAVTDEKWLGFILEQVISNALKYTREGGRVSVRRGEGDSVVISDNGIGIAAEDLPRVFDKGYTGYNGRTDRKSTGIGLYLCKKVCGRLGHAISVSSQAGRGTSVTLNLDRDDLKVE